MMTLEELEQDALKRNIPVMQKEGILFLIEQLQERKATSCLEIGSAIGYSAMMMTTHVEHLCVETIELDEQRYLEAVGHIHEHRLEKRITIHHDEVRKLQSDHRV